MARVLGSGWRNFSLERQQASRIVAPAYRNAPSTEAPGWHRNARQCDGGNLQVDFTNIKIQHILPNLTQAHNIRITMIPLQCAPPPPPSSELPGLVGAPASVRAWAASLPGIPGPSVPETRPARRQRDGDGGGDEAASAGGGRGVGGVGGRGRRPLSLQRWWAWAAPGGAGACRGRLGPRARRTGVLVGFRASPPPPAPRRATTAAAAGDTVVRLVVMSSELPALEDDSFGNVSFTHAHVKYNHALARVSPHALRSSHATLRVLDLRNNNLTAFPLAEQLAAFRRLQYLSVDDNGVEAVPEGVSGLEQLLHLSLANNRVESLHPRALTSLPSLLHLDLHSNRLLALPPQLSALPALRSLLLWDNPFTTLPAGFLGGLHSLEFLDLSYTGVKEIQPTLANHLLRPLVFNLKRTPITELTSSAFINGFLGGLHSLEFLDLSYTGVKEIQPTALATPTSVPWFVNLKRTPITELTSSAFINGSLPYWLDLRETGLRSLDQSFQAILQHMASKNIVHIDWGKPQLWLENEDLACDCSIKWLVTNATLLKHVSGRCNDKNINLRFLDPDYFNIFCF
nr:leucine-rich repeat-containing G-protein coupled receptor 5A-like [Penaeus vannamei]